MMIFILDGQEPARMPEQFAVVLTTKNVESVDPAGEWIMFSKGGASTQGAVAAWHFDGKRMHENVVLEKAAVGVSMDGIRTLSGTPVSLAFRGGKYHVMIGDGFRFTAEAVEDNELAEPIHTVYSPVRGIGVSEIKASRMKAGGTIGGRKVKGTAYFQRVFADSPLIPWEWGVFHFRRGAILTYGNYSLLGVPFGRRLWFSAGAAVHEFRDVSVVMTKGRHPVFRLSAENSGASLRATFRSYATSSWKFRERLMKVIRGELVYSEHLSVVEKLEFLDKKTGKKLTLGDLGWGTGNIEHATGLLP